MINFDLRWLKSGDHRADLLQFFDGTNWSTVETKIDEYQYELYTLTDEEWLTKHGYVRHGGCW